MSLARARDIYSAASSDGGLSFGPNRRVTDRTINRDVGIDSALGSYSFYGPVSAPLPDGGLLTSFMDSRFGDVHNGLQDVVLSRQEPAAEIGSSTISSATRPGLSVRLSRLAYPDGGEGSSGDPVTRVVVANEGDVAGALAGARARPREHGAAAALAGRRVAGALEGRVGAVEARRGPVSYTHLTLPTIYSV